MSARKKSLGRGLDVLLGASAPPAADATASTAIAAAGNELALRQLRPGRYQPRMAMAEEGLAELASSIREQGVLQPLIVRPLADQDAPDITHEIVAGERRWRAAGLAGLAVVPVVIRELDDQSALAVALIENLQREDLNPVEQARSLSRLAREFELTHQQVADAVGRSRSGVSNLLRLLELPDEVHALLA
ncbi:MAG: ParB/RepB/Spo0J family partition protein, partial [Woeseia sp.]